MDRMGRGLAKVGCHRVTGLPPNDEVAGGTSQRETAWGAKALGQYRSLGMPPGGWEQIHYSARAHCIKITALFDIFEPKSCFGAHLFVWDHSRAGVMEGYTPALPTGINNPEREERRDVLDGL